MKTYKRTDTRWPVVPVPVVVVALIIVTIVTSTLWALTESEKIYAGACVDNMVPKIVVARCDCQLFEFATSTCNKKFADKTSSDE